MRRLDESFGNKERHIPGISVIRTFSADDEGEFGSRRPFLMRECSEEKLALASGKGR